MKEKTKILLADAIPQCEKEFTRFIPQKSMEIVGTISDGREIIDNIKSLNPDVLVMDIILPFSDGLEIIKEISDEFKEDKPIIIVTTAAGHEAIIKKAIDYGASYFMTKPCDYKQLIKVIKKFTTINCRKAKSDE